ncbi:MAG: polysaccharide pyruvyl transferase family protein [Muribaculaceae bacterium]|nr:polysaccharide pyruvyl transferase family protein [Muribaculaceae bacterium]
MSRKAALLTMFDVTNYGSVLQTFASQTVLDNLGYECDVINYRFPNEWHFNKGYIKPKVYRLLISKTLSFLGYKTYWSEFRKTIDRFKFGKLNLTADRFETLESLENYDWGKYDVVISGSDQVWNPRFMKGDKAFLLSFAPDDIRKISMSSSFACKTLDPVFRDSYKKYLSRLSAISVRDNNGVDIISSLGIDKPVEVMLDPTLLLPGEQWRKAMKISDSYDSNYILVYILNYAFNPAPFIYQAVKELQKRTGKKVIFTGTVETKYLSGMTNYEIRNGRSVEEFVSMFDNAAMVVTSSFHGTAFAVNFSRPLIAVIPSDGDDRQSSLLANLGIPHCAVKCDTTLSQLNPDYDTTVMRTALDSLREKNIAWLQDSLKK